VSAGFGNSGAGGDISIGGNFFAANGGYMTASAGVYGSGTSGNIFQLGGSIASNGFIRLYADGNVGVQGRVETSGSVDIFAGLDGGYAYGNPSYTSQYGGDIALGAGSNVVASHLKLVANHGSNGDGLSGNITQSAGGNLHVVGVTSLYAYAAGNVELLGDTVVDFAAPVTIHAGYDYPYPGGGVAQAFADKHITINSLSTDGSTVSLDATGQIFANTQNVYAIAANVANSSSGGIVINNTGAAQPMSVSLTDNATANSTVSFAHSGSALVLDGSQSFSTYGGTGSIFVAAPTDILTYNGGTVLSGSDVILAAGSDLNVDSALTGSGALGLGAGGALNVSAGVDAYDVRLGGSTLNVNAPVTAYNNAVLAGSTINVGSSVTADNNVSLLAPLTGGTINLYGGVVANGQAATESFITASNGVSLPYTGIAFVAGNLFAGSGGYLHATDTVLGNISGLVTGDMTLDQGAFFKAGKDIELVLGGSASTLSLLNGGYLHASPTTIKIDFTGRSSGGVIISGPGSGMFVGDPPVAAKPGAGLILTYATTAVIDPCVLDPLLCKPPEVKPPTEGDTPVIDSGKLDPTKPVTDPTKTTGGTEGTFGSEPETDATDETKGQQTAGTKDEKKDEKDEEKDKKDKKSDEAKDEKKDEKPAQKKVAQCT
jgi:filamentous hemagglutinin